MTTQRQRIVIVGANFAGLTAAIKLSRRFDVTVIDPSRHFEWVPNIHEILSSVKPPKALRLDRRAIVAQAGHRFLRDTVTELRPAEGRLLPFQKSELVDPRSAEANIGVPVRPFPRWMRCVKCGLLSPYDAGLFEIKEHRFRPERTRFVHKGCRGSKGDQPAKDADAVPARFLLACRDGHLDDFPWHYFVHGGNSSCQGGLRFFESGASMQTENLWVKCDKCSASRSLAQAFGKAGKENLPSCRGRHPHLDHFDTECDEEARAVLLGATNSWFPITLSALAIPQASDPLNQLVEDGWSFFEDLESEAEVALTVKTLKKTGALPGIDKYLPSAIWLAIEAHRNGGEQESVGESDIKGPCGPGFASDIDAALLRHPILRILLVSDLHYTLPQFDWVVQVASSFDLVVLAGDNLDIGSAVPLDVQSVVVLHYLELLKAASKVAVCSGNHDLTGPDAHGEQSALWLTEAQVAGVPTDGDAITLDDTRLTICPWWDGPLGRHALHQRLEREAALRSARWIWAYHWPPLGSLTCWTGRRDYGDADLRGWITHHQPDIVLTGHVHESPFKPTGSWADRIGRTWVFNAGRQIGQVPAHVVIDLVAGRAVWHSLMGEETLHLADAQAPQRSVF